MIIYVNKFGMITIKDDHCNGSHIARQLEFMATLVNSTNVFIYDVSSKKEESTLTLLIILS